MIDRQTTSPIFRPVHIFIPALFGIPWSQRFFFFFSDERARVAKRRERKTSGYLGLESHFHADDGCQTRQIYNYKTDQWQVGNHMLINRPLGITNQTNQSY